MLKRLRWLGICGLFCASVGCQTLGFTSAVTSNTIEEGEGERQQLPPKEGAKACFIAAEQQEKSNYPKEAAALYERARMLDANYEHVCRRLAVLYDKQSDYPKADIEYAKALKLSPRDANLLNDYGYSFYNRGNWTVAEEQFRKALEIQPDHKRALMNLGMTLAQQGRTDESFDAFTKVVPPAQAHCNLGFLLAAQGKTDEAIRAYRQAAKLAPELPLPHAALAKLEGRGEVLETSDTPTRSAKPKPIPEALTKPSTDYPNPRRDPVRAPEAIAPPIPDTIVAPDFPPLTAPREPTKPRDVPLPDAPEPRIPATPTLEDIPVPPPLPPSKRFTSPD